MAYGGMDPSPQRYGGGRSTVAVLVDSLGTQLGTAYDPSQGTKVNVRLQAAARAIAEVYETNQRMANQSDPARMTDFLPRWEKILGLYPSPSANAPQRRRAVAAKRSMVGKKPTYQQVVDILTSTLTPIPYMLIHGSSSTANVWTPQDWPFGNHASPPPVPSNLVQFLQVYPDWYSTVAELQIKVSKPAGMLDADFYERLGAMNLVLDGFLPAWTTWTWFRQDIHGSPGFFLNDPSNLDNEAFRI